MRLPGFPGGGCPPYKPDDLKEYPPKDSEVARCTEHLQQFWLPAKSVFAGSYRLKHCVESTHGGYCTNGSLIQAAENLGIRIEPDGGGINAKVYVKKNSAAWKAFYAKYPHGRPRFVEGTDEVNDE
jgi:hypothetical protein